MPAHKFMLAGEENAGQRLCASLEEAGFEAHLHAASGVTEALTGIEQELEQRRPSAAISVGVGDEALALAVTAAKLGVPIAAFGAGSGQSGDETRIIATLAGADLGSDPSRAADLITAWLAEPDPSET